MKVTVFALVCTLTILGFTLIAEGNEIVTEAESAPMESAPIGRALEQIESMDFLLGKDIILTDKNLKKNKWILGSKKIKGKDNCQLLPDPLDAWKKEHKKRVFSAGEKGKVTEVKHKAPNEVLFRITSDSGTALQLSCFLKYEGKFHPPAKSQKLTDTSRVNLQKDLFQPLQEKFGLRINVHYKNKPLQNPNARAPAESQALVNSSLPGTPFTEPEKQIELKDKGKQAAPLALPSDDEDDEEEDEDEDNPE